MSSAILAPVLATGVLLTSGVTDLNPRQPAATLPADTQKIPLPAGFHPTALTAADFTGDGKIDAALCGQAGSFLLLAGDGRGALRAVPQPGAEELCGAHPSGIFSADLDGDGRIDVVVANHDTKYVTVLGNRGDGHFSSRRLTVRSNPHPHTVAAADLNDDGRVDVITDSWGDRALLWLPASADGGWTSPGLPIDAGRGPYVNVVAADFDGDGHADLAFPNAVPDSPSDTVSLLLGDGHGRFHPAPQSPIAAGPAPFMVAIGDLNGDGRPDLLVANYSGHITDTARDGLTWVRNDGAGRLTAFPDRSALGHGSWHIASGDLNGDGFADAAFINAADDTVGVAYGSRAGLRYGGTVNVMSSPHRVALADLRGNGHADLLVTTEEIDELYVVSRLLLPVQRVAEIGVARQQPAALVEKEEQGVIDRQQGQRSRGNVWIQTIDHGAAMAGPARQDDPPALERLVSMTGPVEHVRRRPTGRGVSMQRETPLQFEAAGFGAEANSRRDLPARRAPLVHDRSGVMVWR